jgi:hypothetical protein
MVSVLGVESAGTDVKDNELMDGVVGGGGGGGGVTVTAIASSPEHAVLVDD